MKNNKKLQLKKETVIKLNQNLGGRPPRTEFSRCDTTCETGGWCGSMMLC